MKAIKNRKLKILMMDLDLSQTVLAEKAGIPRSTLNAIINGRLIPHGWQEKKIATAIGTPAQEIFG